MRQKALFLIRLVATTKRFQLLRRLSNRQGDWIWSAT
jgi:hypothetical protein